MEGIVGSSLGVGQHLESVCVICMDEPPVWGFLHVDAVHKGVCNTCYLNCYKMVKKIKCPKCRLKVEKLVKVYE